MNKKLLLTAGLLLSVLFAQAQKSVIDVFLEQNPGIESKATCVNISDEMLKVYYKSSKLTPPERYQSISICHAPAMLNKFEKSEDFKKYTPLMEVKKDDGRVIRYFQQVQKEKKEKNMHEIIVCMQYRDDFSVIYLKGKDLSVQSLNMHLELIRGFIDKNKYNNLNIN